MNATSAALAPAVRDYALLGGHTHVEGWLEPGAAATTLVLADAQRRLGIEGPAVEIGVHHGLYFLLLALVAEGGLAIDLFENQHLNVDGSGAGSLAHFERHLHRFHPSPEKVRIEAADSLALDPPTLQAWLGHASPRLFSVDGGHTSRHAENDLRLATAVCGEGAVIIVDDFQNPEWPGVYSGVERYFATPTPWVPLAAGNNKLYIVNSRHHTEFVDALAAAPTAASAVGRTDELFGHPIRRLAFDDPCDALDPASRLALANATSIHAARFDPSARPLARMLAGWSIAEPSGTWSEAPEARLSLLLGDVARRPATLRLRLHAFCPEPSRPVRVRATAGNAPPVDWTFTDAESQQVEIPIPVEIAAPGEWLDLHFSIDGATAPCDRGLSPDSRTLGIALESAQVEPSELAG